METMLWNIAKGSTSKEEFIAKMRREGALEEGFFADLFIYYVDKYSDYTYDNYLRNK